MEIACWAKSDDDDDAVSVIFGAELFDFGCVKSEVVGDEDDFLSVWLCCCFITFMVIEE